MTHIRFEAIVCASLALASGLFGCSSDGSKSATPGTPAPGGSVASPGYSVKDGADLVAPAADDGFQIETPDYDANDANAKNMIVEPNQEIFLCYYITLPNKAEFDVGAFQSYMSPQSSHHFIVYQQGGNNDIPGFLASVPEPNGTITPCGFAGGTWVYATSTPGAVVTSTMPEGVGLPFATGTQLVLNMHFINTGTTVLYPKVKLNILGARNVQYKAGVMVSFNTIDRRPRGHRERARNADRERNVLGPRGLQVLLDEHAHAQARDGGDRELRQRPDPRSRSFTPGPTTLSRLPSSRAPAPTGSTPACRCGTARTS